MTFLNDAAVERLRDAASWPEMPADRYAIRRVIGRGGMGTVYEARDERLGRDVAIKVSNSPVADSDLERRLQREARVLARLEHPGIVPVHEAGVLGDGRLFYVMKLVRGRSLSEALQDRADEATVLGIFERIAEAVAFAHAAGIVHRDLKPSNVMVGSFGEVLVLDWGAAKILASQPSDAGRPGALPAAAGGDRTEAGLRLGTPGFMPPEQAEGRSEVDRTADVYALGALLQWMTQGDGRRAPPRVALPKRLAAIAGKCLSEDPSGRYPDAGALVRDLQRYRAGQAVTAHRESVLDRLGRWYQRYRTAILLVLAYLVMRTLFAVFSR